MSGLEYLVIGWLCGACFVSFAARRRGRRPILWFLIGLALPGLSIPLILFLGERAPREGGRTIQFRPKNPPAPPARCCGRFIADCRGCHFFHRPRLFLDNDPSIAGYCRRFDRTLWKKDAANETQ